MIMQEQGRTPSKYESALKLIEEIEQSSVKMQSAEIDMSGSFVSESKPAPQNYEDILSLINEIERKGRMFSHQKPIQVERRSAEQQAQPQPEMQNAPVQAGTPVTIKAENNAKEELEQLTKVLPLNIPLFSDSKLKRVNISDLVLPNLSMMDQVAELERIIEGIKGGAFNNEDIYIVKEELYGLAKEVNEENKELKKRESYAENDYQLRLLREQRLAQAIDMLSSRVNAN
jgi:hypothetical protein